MLPLKAMNRCRECVRVHRCTTSGKQVYLQRIHCLSAHTPRTRPSSTPYTPRIHPSHTPPPLLSRPWATAYGMVETSTLDVQPSNALMYDARRREVMLPCYLAVGPRPKHSCARHVTRCNSTSDTVPMAHWLLPAISLEPIPLDRRELECVWMTRRAI